MYAYMYNFVCIVQNAVEIAVFSLAPETAHVEWKMACMTQFPRPLSETRAWIKWRQAFGAFVFNNN